MDLQNKYQILASEFSKVRGQVTVLKKAVIEEQSKSQQLQVMSRPSFVQRVVAHVHDLVFVLQGRC